MRIVITTPDGLAKVKTVTSLAALRGEFPRVSFVANVTDQHLIAQNLPARVSQEVAAPNLSHGQSASPDDERQSDGTWLQVWAITTRPIADLKAEATTAANNLGRDKISTLELARGLAAGTIRPRTQAVLDKVDEIRSRIDAATTGAEIKVILDELDAF